MSDFLEKLPINWPMIANPYNWIVIFLMISIVGVGATWIMDARNPKPATDETKDS